jgi:hypothetical protein
VRGRCRAAGEPPVLDLVISRPQYHIASSLSTHRLQTPLARIPWNRIRRPNSQTYLPRLKVSDYRKHSRTKNSPYNVPPAVSFIHPVISSPRCGPDKGKSLILMVICSILVVHPHRFEWKRPDRHCCQVARPEAVSQLEIPPTVIERMLRPLFNLCVLRFYRDKPSNIIYLK